MGGRRILSSLRPGGKFPPGRPDGALADTAAQEETWARQDEAREKDLKKNQARQLTAVALVTAALLTEFVAARFIDIPGAVSTAVVVVLCVLAIYVLRRRT